MNTPMTEEAVVARWKMSDSEAKAYHIGRVWVTEVPKIFPELTSYSKFPRGGDPRKCNLFHFCWKLMRETRGLLKDEEYRLYVMANLHILKIQQGYVEINVLCGNKAWYRWLVWKRHFEIKSQQMAGDRLLEEKQVDKKFFRDVGLTKKFLYERCDGKPTLEKLQAFSSGPKMKMWVGSQKVSPYYLVLSPWIAKICDKSSLMDKFQIDSSVYEQKLDEPAKKHFRKEFAHEFS